MISWYWVGSGHCAAAQVPILPTFFHPNWLVPKSLHKIITFIGSGCKFYWIQCKIQFNPKSEFSKCGIWFKENFLKCNLKWCGIWSEENILKSNLNNAESELRKISSNAVWNDAESYLRKKSAHKITTRTTTT